MALLEPVARAVRSFNAQPRVRREILLFGPALLFGLIVVPLLVWAVGTRILGPYTRGTEPHDRPLALMGDYFAGLAHGLPVFWLVALGPAVILLIFRVLLRLLRPPAPPVEAPPAGQPTVKPVAKPRPRP